MTPPRKPYRRRKAGRPEMTNAQLEHQRKTCWRCSTCFSWHPSLAAREACKHDQRQRGRA